MKRYGMGTWRTRRMKGPNGRLINRNGGGTQKKGVTCQTNAFKKFMSKRGRSYRHRLYGEWCANPEKLQSF